jgi:hypothetical protein
MGFHTSSLEFSLQAAGSIGEQSRKLKFEI